PEAIAARLMVTWRIVKAGRAEDGTSTGSCSNYWPAMTMARGDHREPPSSTDSRRQPPFALQGNKVWPARDHQSLSDSKRRVPQSVVRMPRTRIRRSRRKPGEMVLKIV